MGIKSTNGTMDHIRAIERKGWLVWNEPTPGVRHRGYRLADALVLDLSDMTPDEQERVASYAEHIRSLRPRAA